ncbi:MAG: AAA family ATPase, partial [Xanthobacteraceae bacterium]
MDQIHIAQGVAGNKPKRDDGILGHFETWWEAEFKTELLPVIPHGATISPRSKIKEGGKTPGLKTNDGWTGFPNWPAYQFEYKDVKTCGDMGANVGLQLRQFKAADLDVNNEELAKTIEEIAIHTLGDAPVRTRPNSSRRLLLYRGKGFRTRRVRFMDANGNSHTVELLGEHQDPERATQCVVEGITKSGKLKWRNWHPCERGGANGLTELTPEHVNAFFGELISTLDMLGCTIIPHGEGSSTAQPRKPFDAPGMAAPSPEHVKKALKHLENTYKNFPERGDFVAVGAAIYASYGPDREQYYLDFEEWAIEGYPENTPEFVRQVWDSFAKGVSIGWDWLSGLARGKGYEDDSAQEDFKDDPPPEYMPPPDPLAEYLPYPLPERAKPKRSIPVIRVDYDEPLPMRQFLYGKHYARKYLSSTIAPGGLGKSTLLTAETTAMGAGKSLLLGEPATPPLRTWYINGEDDEEEIKRKFMAVARYHGLTNEDIGGRLLVNSGRSYNFVVAVGGRGSIEIKEEVVAAIKDYIKSNGIDVVIIDPFVAFHGVSENDNQQINTVCRVWRGIAEECN